MISRLISRKAWEQRNKHTSLHTGLAALQPTSDLLRQLFDTQHALVLRKDEVARGLPLHQAAVLALLGALVLLVDALGRLAGAVGVGRLPGARRALALSTKGGVVRRQVGGLVLDAVLRRCVLDAQIGAGIGVVVGDVVVVLVGRGVEGVVKGLFDVEL